MNRVKFSNVNCILMLALVVTGNVYAFDLGDALSAAKTLKKGEKTLHQGKAVTEAVGNAATGTALTALLTQQLGVSEAQATGGAGAVFQLAKSKMEADAFAKLSSSVPGMDGLLAAAPVVNAVSGGSLGNLGGLAGGLAGNLGGSVGNLVSLASSFQQLGLSPKMVERFVPIVVQYVQGTGGSAATSLLQAALMGGL